MNFLRKNILNHYSKTLSLKEPLRVGMYCNNQLQATFQSLNEEQNKDNHHNKEEFNQNKSYDYKENNDKDRQHRYRYSQYNDSNNYSFYIVLPLLALLGQKLNSVSCLFGSGPEVIPIFMYMPF